MKHKKTMIALVALATISLWSFWLPMQASAATDFFDSGIGTGDWSTASNWIISRSVPANGDDVKLNSYCQDATCLHNKTDNPFTVNYNYNPTNVTLSNLYFNFNNSSKQAVTLNLNSGTLTVGHLYLYPYVSTGTATSNQTSTANLSATTIDLQSLATFSKSGSGTLTFTNFNQSGGTSSFTGSGSTLTLDSNAKNYNLSGGTLTAGTIQLNTGGTFTETGGTISGLGTLTLNGDTLNLGTGTITVSTDYSNANFGIPNSFNPHANVTGYINASNAGQQITETNVTGGTTVNATLAFGNVHVGSTATTANYQIMNSGTSGGTSIRGAIQTSGNGNITDARLTGTGVTAGNFGPIAAAGSSSALGVTFTPTTAGALLTGQKVYIINNFDNVTEQTLNITGAAYRYAAANTITTPINLGNVHVGGTFGTSALSITNTATNDGYSEKLSAGFGTLTGQASTNGGSFSQLAAGSTNSTAQTPCTSARGPLS